MALLELVEVGGPPAREPSLAFGLQLHNVARRIRGHARHMAVEGPFEHRAYPLEAAVGCLRGSSLAVADDGHGGDVEMRQRCRTAGRSRGSVRRSSCPPASSHGAN